MSTTFSVVFEKLSYLQCGYVAKAFSLGAAYAAKIIGKFKLNKYFIRVQWTLPSKQFVAACLSYAPILYVAICHHYQPFVVVVVKPLNVMSAIYMASA